MRNKNPVLAKFLFISNQCFVFSFFCHKQRSSIKHRLSSIIFRNLSWYYRSQYQDCISTDRNPLMSGQLTVPVQPEYQHQQLVRFPPQLLPSPAGLCSFQSSALLNVEWWVELFLVYIWTASHCLASTKLKLSEKFWLCHGIVSRVPLTVRSLLILTREPFTPQYGRDCSEWWWSGRD